jgi:benzoyl-CoA reductase/2-hydroxyglutaryl-CoA dehydratase subunit BcrC/BadD/HgdB
VYNEMPREFAMLPGDMPVEELYFKYTYPYDIFYRAEKLVAEVRRRGAGAVVHYVQSFCYRQIQDRLLRELLGVPVLTLECDRPGGLDAGARTRVEAFLESLRAAEGRR